MSKRLSFNDCDYIDGLYYAASNISNEFFRFNDFGYEVLFRFDDEDNAKNLFMQTVQIDQKIILTPSSSKKIYIYDTYSRSLSAISIIDAGVADHKFHGVLIVDEYAYFFPVCYPAIIKLNTTNMDVSYVKKPIDKLIEESKVPFPSLSYGFYCNNKVVSHQLYTDYLFCMDLSTEENEFRRIPSEDGKIWGYYNDGNYEYCITSFGVRIIRDDQIVFEDNSYRYDEGNYFFSPCQYGDKIVFFPFKDHLSAKPILIQHAEDDLFKIDEVRADFKMTLNCLMQDGGRVYAIRNADCSFMCFDFKESSFSIIKEGSIDDYLVEGRIFGIREWMDYI